MAEAGVEPRHRAANRPFVERTLDDPDTYRARVTTSLDVSASALSALAAGDELLGDRFGGISHAGNRTDLAEVRANAFAAHFLMPESGVKTFLKSVGKGEGTRQNLEIYDEREEVPAQKRMPAGSQEVRVHDVVGLSHHFGASYEAALYHLLNLRIIRRDNFEALWENREAQGPIRRAFRIPEWDEAFHSHLVEQLLSLGFEAYGREEISRGKLIELAAQAGVHREEMEEALHDAQPRPEPIEAILPGE